MIRAPWRVALAGLSALAAALCSAVPHAAAAQSTSGDTLSKQSAPPKPQRADSIQARFGRDDVMPTLDIGQSYSFDRDALFRSGALTLGDLLERVPGFTTFRAGWLRSPEVTAYAGDFSRVRVFFDGIEMDDLNGRDGAAPDYENVPIWALEKLSLVRTAMGLRVDMRSWEYNVTRPYTRVDVLTGDLNTNLYRAFYGKRYYNGAGLQIIAQQYGVTDTRNGGGGQQFGIFARYGVARGIWSFDATALRMNGTRTITTPYGGGEAVPNYRSANTIGYVRAAVGHEGHGPFLQLVASSEILKETSSHFNASMAAQYGFPPDTVDSLASVAQYVATAGLDAGASRVRLIERYRRRLGRGYNSPSATYDLTTNFLSLSGIAERDEYAGLNRLEAGARLLPLPFFAVSGYVGQRTSFGTPAPEHVVQPSSRSATVEGGVRLFAGGPWATVGVITRDTAVLVPPVVFDSAFITQAVGRQSGTTLGVRGELTHGFSIDATGTRWGSVNPYTPQTEAHAEVRFSTQWLARFPTGNFSFLLAPALDYRSTVAFPTNGGDRFAGAYVNPVGGVYSKSAASVYSVLVEIRILRAVISYQRRNVSSLIYDQVPGLLMPRPLNVYGVRWYFFD